MFPSLLAFALAIPLLAADPDLAEALKALRAVSVEGQGNAAATAAWRRLAAADAGELPVILAAFDGANDYAVNWLRPAVEAVAQRAAHAGRPLPLAGLETFLRDTRHHPRARRLAYELIAAARPEAAARLLADFTNDPGAELRRDAVQQLVAAAAQLTNRAPAEAIKGYRQALAFAREPDQVDAIAKALGGLGEPVNLQKTFGWLTQWKVVGPFDNTAGKGFEQAYPPEQGVDFTAQYDGKAGKVAWQDYTTTHDYGLVDLNQPLGRLKEVTGYACAEFWSDTARPVELRLGSKNGWKVWLNGKFLFGRDEYHRGMEIDQYRMAAELQPGRNVILVKLCQNEQVEDWTVEWEFQLRLTDPLGTPVASTR